MPKHTPGPWYAERLRLDGHEWFVKSECRELPPYHWMPRLNVKIDAIRPVHGKYVDCCSGSGSTDEGRCPLAISENAANAALISAAPDMLAVLRMVNAVLTDNGCLNRGGETHQELEAVIAKAEGRS